MMQHNIDGHQQHHMHNYSRIDESNPGDVIVGISAPSQYPNAPLIGQTSCSTTGLPMPSKPFAFDALILSIVSYMCCCPLLGLFGIIASLLSYSDHRVNDLVSHNSKRNIALGCSIAGIVIGVLAIVTMIIIFSSA